MIYLDLDGVLADFDLHYRERIGSLPERDNFRNLQWDKFVNTDFYATIPPMPDFQEFKKFFTVLGNPTILTGIPQNHENDNQKSKKAILNKRAWLDQHWSKDIPMIGCWSREKYLYCRPGDILVDDWDKYKSEWVMQGGLFIKHLNAKSSIEELEMILFGD